MPDLEPTVQPALPFPQLDRYERLDLLPRLDEGFLPTSQREQVEQLSLQSYLEVPGGAAKHLAEVARRKSKEGDTDPLRAARRITRSYIEYAVDAQVSSRHLDNLEEELTDANPKLILSRVVSAETPGVLTFMRFFDLSMLRQEGEAYAWRAGYDPQKVTYSTDNPGIMHYAREAVERWRVHPVRRRLPEAKLDQAHRMGFWLERLVEVQKHYPRLRPIVQEGLDTIYGSTPAA